MMKTNTGLDKITQICLRNERLFVNICKIFLFLIIVVRLCMAWRTAMFTDTRFYIETANFVRQGVSPYKPEVYLPKFGMAPVQSPSMATLIMPLCFFPQIVHYIFMFSIGTIAFYAYILLVLKYYGFDYKVFVKAKWSNLPIMIVFTCMCISSPFLGMLRAGQNSSVAALLLFLALLFPAKDKTASIIYLALSAAVKYSLMTMQVPILVLQKRLKMSVIAFLVFVLLCFSLAFWLDDIIYVFKDYIKCTIDSTSEGGNAYGDGAFFFLNIGFIKNNIANICLKLFVCCLYLGLLFLIWKYRKNDDNALPSRLTAVEWGIFTVMTIFISYHRIQDGVLFIPFLGCVFLELLYRYFKGKEKICLKFIIQCLGMLFWVLFWSIPSNFVFRIGSFVGKCFPGGEKYFYYTDDALGGCLKIFPIMQFVMLFMICFLSWIEVSQLLGKSQEPYELEKQ